MTGTLVVGILLGVALLVIVASVLIIVQLKKQIIKLTANNMKLADQDNHQYQQLR